MSRWTRFYILALALLLPASVRAQIPNELAEDQCIACHVDIEMMPTGYVAYDAHMRRSLSCAGCHGGDPTTDDMDLAMSPDAGFVGVPSPQQIPAFCGKCHSDEGFMRRYVPGIHTDQQDQYYTSLHGQRLREGDLRVATCTGCHTSHAILGAQDSRSTVYPLNVPQTCNRCHGDERRMSRYGIPTDQYEKYAASIHGKKLLEEDDLSAPVCNDCHGNHGAMPPEAASIDEVCGSCHANNLDFFRESLMSGPYDEQNKHACAECHGYHTVEKTTDAMLGVEEGSVCIRCHESGDQGYEVAAELFNQVAGLVQLRDSATVQMEAVRRLGMDDVEISFLLQDATQSLVHARNLIHTMDPSRVAVRTDEGRTAALQAIELAYDEIYQERDRRIGFGIATLFATLLAIGLYLKIRQMESDQKAEA